MHAVTEAVNRWSFSLEKDYVDFLYFFSQFCYWPICPTSGVWAHLLLVRAGVGVLGKLTGSFLAALSPIHWLCLFIFVSVQKEKKNPILLKAELVCWKNAHLQVRNCLSQDKGTDCLALSGFKHSEQSGLCHFLWEITLLNSSEYQEVGFLPWVFNLKFSLI